MAKAMTFDGTSIREEASRISESQELDEMLRQLSELKSRVPTATRAAARPEPDAERSLAKAKDELRRAFSGW